MELDRTDALIHSCEFAIARAHVTLMETLRDRVEQEFDDLYDPEEQNELYKQEDHSIHEDYAVFVEVHGRIALRAARLAWIAADLEGAVEALEQRIVTVASGDVQAATRAMHMTVRDELEIPGPRPGDFLSRYHLEGVSMSTWVESTTRGLACALRQGDREEALDIKTLLVMNLTRMAPEDAAAAYRWLAIHEIGLREFRRADDFLASSLEAVRGSESPRLIDNVLAGFVAAHLTLARGDKPIGRELFLSTTVRALELGLVWASLKAHRVMRPLLGD